MQLCGLFQRRRNKWLHSETLECPPCYLASPLHRAILPRVLFTRYPHSVAPGPSGRTPVIYTSTPESAAEALANPPTKRRRAKRTEEQRISYLRADPYVAQFEAYRVLCASCDKWIRLRPNSTYCSIPWDSTLR